MHTAWNDGTLRFSYTTLDELEPIADMLAKETVCEHVYFGPNTRAETSAYFTPILEPMNEALERGELPASHVFTVRLQEDATFVGECALVPVPFGTGNFVVGYQFDDPFWGRGYGTRACRFLVWYGFEVLGSHRLSGDCLATNAGSARILEKCGFRAEGRQRAFYHPRGTLRDNLLFGLLRHELTLDLAELSGQLQPSQR